MFSARPFLFNGCSRFWTGLTAPPIAIQNERCAARAIHQHGVDDTAHARFPSPAVGRIELPVFRRAGQVRSCSERSAVLENLPSGAAAWPSNCWVCGKTGLPNFESRQSGRRHARGPAVVPSKGRDLERGLAGDGVVGVEDDNVVLGSRQDGLASGSQPPAIASSSSVPPPCSMGLPSRIHVGPGNAGCDRPTMVR